MPTLPTNEILVINRQRLDYGDLSDLATSMQSYGLIQPIIVNHDKRLIAGGRRLAAAQHLGWQSIDVVYRETLSDEELHILELEENVRRKDQTWAEKCLHIDTIHRMKVRQAGADGDKWSQRMTGEMLGISNANVNFNVIVAARLRSELGPDGKPLPNAIFWSCDGIKSALDLINREHQAEYEKELQKEHIELAANVPLTVTQELEEFANVTTEEINLQKEEAHKRYLANPHNDPAAFEAYYAEKLARDNSPTIYLSHRLFNVDCLEFMAANEGRFDHIITDPPYGIDVEYMNQDNKGIQNIDTITAEHQVEDNLKMMVKFWEAAWKCTKERAFVITWCDYWIFRYLANQADMAGFRVQRWPFLWIKPSGLNQMASYNFTKNHECCLIAAKPGTTLIQPQPTSHVFCSREDDITSAMDHPFAKPLSTWEPLINAVSIEGQSILEPFAGEGSGVLSMLSLKRNVISCESNTTHYLKQVERVKQFYLRQHPGCIFK